MSSSPTQLPHHTCNTCHKEQAVHTMVLANEAWYCDATCYGQSQQTCYSCGRHSVASALASTFEGSPTPGNTLLYTCQGIDAATCRPTPP
jgi:hypothetical protein